MLFFGADRTATVFQVLGELRVELARRLKLLDATVFRFVWVTDFPLLAYDDKEKRFQALHHPFTAPRDEDIQYLKTDPGRVKANAYDMVLNGTEIGGGSVRIHRQEMQSMVFDLLGIAPDEARAKFGFLLDALKFGCPPHGGLAFGLDRLVMLMVGATSIRDVMAFPKTQSAACLLTQAPAPVTEAQLRDHYLRTAVTIRAQMGPQPQPA